MEATESATETSNLANDLSPRLWRAMPDFLKRSSWGFAHKDIRYANFIAPRATAVKSEVGNSKISPEYLYENTSGTGIVLFFLMYLRVAASLTKRSKLTLGDAIAPSTRGERKTHWWLSMNVMNTAQFRLPLAGFCSGSQTQGLPPRSLLARLQRAVTLKEE